MKKPKTKKKGCFQIVLIFIAAMILLGMLVNNGSKDELPHTQSNNSNKSQPKQEAVKPYEYTEIEREDVSYAATPRMTVRIKLLTDTKPDRERMIITAKEIHSNASDKWKEFTVFMIYGEMENFNYGAYGAAEFTPEGLKEFNAYESCLDAWKMAE